MAPPPTKAVTFLWAAFYVLSGVCQPLLMTMCQAAGLANHTAQLYMFAYYLGPSLLLATVWNDPDWPPARRVVLQACGIALLDIVAQTLNYTGASWAGPTVFAIVYSSVTVWTAVVSRVLLSRTLTAPQWAAVWVVFGGLCVTATNSLQLGSSVTQGTALVVLGSALHGSAYVLSEAIMKEDVVLHTLTVRQNAAIQGTVACLSLGIWQVVFTLPRWQNVLGGPLQQAGTSGWEAVAILAAFALANLVHSVTFSHTLKYYPGGATSAGVMKGLQAVLVFVAAHWLFCGRIGGTEMCFTPTKLVSLLTVSGGVAWFGILAEHGGRVPSTPLTHKAGYSSIDSTLEGDVQELDPL